MQTGVPTLSGDSSAQVNYAFSQQIATYLTNLVKQILNVTLNSASLNALQSYVAQGVTLNQIAIAYAECDQSYYNDYNTYVSVFGVGPTTAEAYAVASLELYNGYTLQDIRTSLVNSTVNVGDLQLISNNALGRDATSQQVAALEQAQINGASITQIVACIATSQEAVNDDSGIYQAVLGYAAGTTDLQYAEGLIEKGSTLGGLRTTLADSQAGANSVNNRFLSIVGRPATANDLAAWQGYLASGGALTGLNARLAATQECATALGNQFSHILGRPATANDLAAWQGYLANGGTLSGLDAFEAATQECANAVSNQFSQILGRPAGAADLVFWQNYLAGGGSLSGLDSAVAYSQESTTGITDFLNALNVPASAVSSYINVAESSLAAGYGILGAAETFVAQGAIDAPLTQLDQDFGKTAAAIASDISQLHSQVESALTSLSNQAVTWSEAIGTAAVVTMQFISQAFAADPSGGGSALTAQQAAQYRADVATATASGTAKPPPGATLIDGSPLLTAFCSIFDLKSPTYHQYAVEFDINNGGQAISVQQALQYLGRDPVPGEPIASAPLANGAVSKCIRMAC